MILISNDFWHNRKMYNFDSYNVLLVIATNIAVLLMTAAGSRWNYYYYYYADNCWEICFISIFTHRIQQMETTFIHQMNPESSEQCVWKINKAFTWLWSSVMISKTWFMKRSFSRIFVLNVLLMLRVLQNVSRTFKCNIPDETCNKCNKCSINVCKWWNVTLMSVSDEM